MDYESKLLVLEYIVLVNRWADEMLDIADEIFVDELHMDSINRLSVLSHDLSDVEDRLVKICGLGENSSIEDIKRLIGDMKK